MEKQTLQLRTNILAERMRPYKPRPLAPFVPRYKDGTLTPRRMATNVVDRSSVAIQSSVSNAEQDSCKVSGGVNQNRLPQYTTVTLENYSKSTSELNFEQNAMLWRQDKRKKHFAIPRFWPTKQRFVSMLLVGMACVVFLFGIFASLHSLKLDKELSASVAAQPAVSQDNNQSADEEIKEYRVAPDMPRYITISSIGVHARVLHVGINKGGEMQTPNNVYDTGWYKGSAKPGSSLGASIIDGHVTGVSQNGVFYNLKKVIEGDIITIEKGDGTIISYKVVKKEIADVEKIDMNKMFQTVNKDRHGLNLISCTGTFDPNTKTYSQRIMIFTEIIK